MPASKGSTPWNAGTSKGWVDQRGYRWLYVMEGGKRRARREHRILVERRLGRRLEPWEVVHHKDGNKQNNVLENLEVQEFGEHTRDHHLGGRKSQDTRRSMEAFALMREELKREREVKADLLEKAAAVLAMCDAIGDFRNGVTDPAGSIDEGAVRAGELLSDLRAAINRATGAAEREA